jgi:hypothetical protein
MKIVARGSVVHPEAAGDHQSSTFPYLCVLPEGRWLCSFRAGPAKLPMPGQHIRVTWSDDEGKTWTPPARPFPAPPHDDRPGIFRAGPLTALGGRRVLAALSWVDHTHPDLDFFNEQTMGLLDTRICFSFSEDGGETWSSPTFMDTTPFHVPTPLTGPLLLLPDSRWACQIELNKPYYDTSPWRHRSVLMFSRDEGKTWPEHAYTSPEGNVFYWDQRPALLADGRLLNVFWTFDTATNVYLNIHAARSDDGRTWTAPWDVGVPGQPAPPVSLPDGRIAMVYVDRTAQPIIKLRVSSDGAKTFPAATELLLYCFDGSQTWRKGSMQDTWAEMGAFSVGLPSTALLPDGDILVVYYAGPHTDHTDIEWVRIRP